MSAQQPIYAFSNLKLVAIVLAMVGVIIGGVAIYEYPNSIRGASAGSPLENRESVSIEITIRDYEFEPATLEIPRGAVVRLKVVNLGDNNHGILIPDFGVSRNISQGDSESLSFTADTAKPLVYFYCAFPACGSPIQHGGMKGTITIT